MMWSRMRTLKGQRPALDEAGVSASKVCKECWVKEARKSIRPGRAASRAMNEKEQY